MTPKTFHLHLVSDSTGETIQSVARACVAQFEGVEPIEHFWNLVRTHRQLELVLEDIERNRGVVVYTLVDDRLRQHLSDVCLRQDVPCISVLDPILMAFARHLNMQSQSRPRSEEHTSERQSLMRISYDVFCSKKKNDN